MQPKWEVCLIILLVILGWIVVSNTLSHAQDWTYTPGTANVTAAAVESAYQEALKDALKSHPDWKAPPRSPKWKVITPQEVCDTTHDTAPCAVALTCGEYGQCAGWPDEDILFSEDFDYQSRLGYSVLYHESWHYLQFYNQGPIADMHRLLCAENEAYTEQLVMLKRHGGDPISERKLINQIMRYPCQPY